MNNILVMDTETGGLDNQMDGLCSVSLKVFGKEIWCNFFVKPNPQLNYNSKALSINGLTLEQLEAEGVTEGEATARVLDFIFKNFQGKPNVLGQNVGFDLGFLNSLFRRNKNHNFDAMIWHAKYDTLSNSIFMKNAGIIHLGKTNLASAYRFFTGKQPMNAHQAAADVRMTEELFKAQCRFIVGLRRSAL